MFTRNLFILQLLLNFNKNVLRSKVYQILSINTLKPTTKVSTYCYSMFKKIFNKPLNFLLNEAIYLLLNSYLTVAESNYIFFVYLKMKFLVLILTNV